MIFLEEGDCGRKVLTLACVMKTWQQQFFDLVTIKMKKKVKGCCYWLKKVIVL